MRRVARLVAHDLAVSFKNRAVHLLVFVPVFTFVAISFVDRPAASPLPIKIGLIPGAAYPPGLVAAIAAQPKLFDLKSPADAATARQEVKALEWDAALVPGAEGAGGATLLVKDRASPIAIATLEALANLQRSAMRQPPWITKLDAVTADADIQLRTLPVWILTLILLVGLMVMPPQVAEEKEKFLLHGLMQTPLRESEWLVAKTSTGVILATVASSLLLAFDGAFATAGPGLILLLLGGSFCFTSLGVLIGHLCRSQASARTIGVMFYLPCLLPAALGDFSRQLSAVAAYLPTSQLFVPLRAVLLEGADLGVIRLRLAALVAMGLVFSAITLALVKSRRWM